jgi:integrase
MSHSVKRGKSRFEQFRMIVPEDVREVIGKTAWTESLRTTDPFVAREKRAELIIRCTAEIRQAREGIVDRAKAHAIELLDRAFSLLAQARGTMDRAIQLPLQLLGSFVLDSWVGTGRDMGAQWWGDFLVREPLTFDEAIPSFDNERERAMYRLRADLVEGRGIADGLVYQELAAILLDRRVFHPIWCVVSYMRSLEPRLPLAPDATYEVVAEAFLRRLAEYQFESWPENVADALAPLGRGAVPIPTSRSQPAPVEMRYQGLLAMRLSEGLQYWIDQRRPGQSAVNEARRGVARYIALFGDVIIGTINRAQVIEFRNLIADIPPQTELAKLTAKGKTLRSVIDQAREERQAWETSDRQMPEPGRLAPGSVKKDVGSISQILGAVQSDLGEGTNVAARIQIAGYTKNRQGQQRPHLPFTPAMMQRLFDSPLFTGCAGISDIDRTQPGPHVFQDELYWCLLFGVVGGPRLGEIGQLALDNVHDCDLHRTFGGDITGNCTFLHITGTGSGQKTKNEASERYVVLHEKLIELGFLNYVEGRRKTGKKRLFDLKATKGASLTKGLSQRLNRYLDRVVTDDPRYVFHSTRHEFTDRADLSQMPTRAANSIKGHANLTEGEKYGLVSIQLQHIHLKNLKVGFIDWPRLIAAARARDSSS